MAFILQRLGEEQVCDEVGRDKGIVGEAAETYKGGLREEVADEVAADKAAEQQHRLFQRKVVEMAKETWQAGPKHSSCPDPLSSPCRAT